MAQSEDDFYYVPVTRRVDNTKKMMWPLSINELIEGPGMQTALVSGLIGDVKLMDAPKIENGNVVLNFNEEVLGSSEGNIISEVTLRSLVLSLTDKVILKVSLLW